jgi:hypothetical protein
MFDLPILLGQRFWKMIILSSALGQERNGLVFPSSMVWDSNTGLCSFSLKLPVIDIKEWAWLILVKFQIQTIAIVSYHRLLQCPTLLETFTGVSSVVSFSLGN